MLKLFICKAKRCISIALATKAEFDAALSDFNARLTTFEAGINSKIDSQVSSYLDRNGIWNGKEQTLTHPNGIYWYNSCFDCEWIQIKEIVEHESETFKQQMIWELKKKDVMVDDDPANKQTIWAYEPKVGFWTQQTALSGSLNCWVPKGSLGHRRAEKDVVLEINKSGAVFLDVCLQRIINNQNFNVNNDYVKLYAAYKFLEDFRTDNTVRLTSYHNLWDPSNPSYATFAGDSYLTIQAPEDWVRNMNINCNSFVTIKLDDTPAASWFLQATIPSAQWQTTANINGVDFAPGNDIIDHVTSPAGKEYTIHSSYGFGNGLAIQSTEPIEVGGLVFAKKGQKLSISVDDIFNGRRWKDYIVVCGNSLLQSWTDPDFTLLNDANDDFKSVTQYANGYFLQVVNCVVY